MSGCIRFTSASMSAGISSKDRTFAPDPREIIPPGWPGILSQGDQVRMSLKYHSANGLPLDGSATSDNAPL